MRPSLSVTGVVCGVLCYLLATLSSLSPVACQPNLLTNGAFEAGSFYGWVSPHCSQIVECTTSVD